MSAIYGVINLDKKTINNELLNKMESEYKDFKIDRFSSICVKNAAFGTGLIYITGQSKTEILPFYDKINENLFTSDCYLDNRDELIDLLVEQGSSIGINIDEKTPDGMLIYLSYLKWGHKLCDHLLGVFAIAIYSFKDNQFYMYVDHCGDRCVHYYLKNNTIYFSTIIRPIQAANNFNIEVSEKYIAACESNLSADMVLYPGLSPYEGIYQLLSGQRLHAFFADNKVTYKVDQYWNPVKDIKPLVFKSDEEYKKLFLETYNKCVVDALNVDGNIGCFLSSGLDSSSVAALAANHLKKSERTLHSYTSVPLKDYSPTNGFRLEDESVPVKKFCDYFGNIIPTFVSCEGKSALTELERFVKLFNSPIKYSVNAVWIDEIYHKASEDGCKVLLKGQHGNSSVSYGSLITRMWYEFKALHFRTIISLYKEFSKKYHIHKKAFISTILSELKGEFFPSIDLKYALTRSDLLKKYNIHSEYIKKCKLLGSDCIHSELQRKNSIYMPASFQQVSYANAHFELKNGLIARDPTRDKRIIELCIAMPIWCFADGSNERKLITGYMKEIIPDFILKQMYNRGIQSADFITRINKFSDDKIKEIEELSFIELLNYVNEEKVKTAFNNYNDKNTTLSIMAYVNLAALILFLNRKDH